MKHKVSGTVLGAEDSLPSDARSTGGAADRRVPIGKRDANEAGKGQAGRTRSSEDDASLALTLKGELESGRQVKKEAGRAFQAEVAAGAQARGGRKSSTYQEIKGLQVARVAVAVTRLLVWGSWLQEMSQCINDSAQLN